MLKKFWWMALVILLVIIPLSAQDTGIALRTFINPAFAVQGLRPQNWSETARYSGVYRPETNLADRTLLVIQAGEMEVADVMASLVGLYDLAAPPSRIARNRSDTLSWSIYKIERRIGSQTLYVDIAIAQDDERVFFVLMQTNQPTYDQLHEDVFLVVIDSIESVGAVDDSGDMQVGVRETVTPTPPAETTPEATAEATAEVTPEITPEATEASGD
jgi:hypothetical protein